MSPKNKSDPLLIITYANGIGRASEIQVSRSLLFHHSPLAQSRVSRITQSISKDGSPQYYFKNLVASEAKDDLEHLWEAFQSFITWMHNGIYTNPQIVSNHIDAFNLAVILKSPRFADTVVEKVMQDLPGRKFDPELKDHFRQVFTFRTSSRIRKLYFDTAIYWGLDLVDDQKTSRFSRVLLRFEADIDGPLTKAFQKYKQDFCSCTGRDSRWKSDVNKIPRLTDFVETCKCQIAPWDPVLRERYFQKV